MTTTWVIEYDFGKPPAWIAAEITNHSFGVTYDFNKARRFTNGEDARNEILRLGLSCGCWKAVERNLPS